MSLLDNQPSVFNMMHAPLFCLLICDLFQEENGLPSKITDIFQKVVEILLRRYAQTRRLKAPFKDWTDAPPCLRELIIGLGKVAFHGLQKKQLYFTDVELKEAGMPAEALKLGLLTKSESTNFLKRDEYTFSHLTLQEFLAALYVSREFLQTGADMDKLLRTVSLDDGHLTTFWVFLAGLLEESFVELLLQLLRYSVSSYDSGAQLYRCYAESCFGQTDTPSANISLFLERRLGNFFFDSFKGLSASDCAAIGTVLRSHTKSKYIRTVKFVCRCMTATGFSQVLSGLRRCKSIETLRMERIALHPEDMPALNAVLENNAHTLEGVYLNGNNIDDEGLEKLSEGLKLCRRLKELTLAWNDLTSRSGSTLCDVLSRLPSLEKLGVCHNHLEDDGMEQLIKGILHCTHLKQLYVWSTSISDLSLDILRGLLEFMPSLRLVVGQDVFKRDIACLSYDLEPNRVIFVQ